MCFETYLVPVSIDDGYRYDLRKTGRMVGTAMLDDGLWIANPCDPKSGEFDTAKAKSFKRLAGAEYYLLALVLDGDDYY